MSSILWLLCSCSLFSQDVPLAKIGSKTLMRSEFLARYELTPGINRNVPSSLQYNKAEFLFSLIAEKLLATEAAQRGIDTTSDFRNEITRVERLLTRDELYQQEVRRKVHIKSSEIDSLLPIASAEISFRFLSVQSKNTAQNISIQLKKGRTLSEIIVKKKIAGEIQGPDSAVARWGEIDDQLANVIFTMQPGETSKPIQLDDGFYVVTILSKRISHSTGAGEQLALRERVEATLRRQKEQHKMLDVMKQILSNRSSSIRVVPFKSLVQTIYHLAQNHVSTDSLNRFYVTVQVADTLNHLLNMHDSLFVIMPHDSWTVNQVVQKLVSTRFVLNPVSENLVRSALEERIRDFIDQDQITEIAVRRELNTSSAVQNDLRPWRDSFLALFLKKAVVFADTVTERPLMPFADIHDHRAAILVKMRRIDVASREKTDSCWRVLHNGVSFDSLLCAVPGNEENCMTLGKEDYHRLKDLGTKYDTLAGCEIGSVLVFRQDRDRFSLIQLLGRRYLMVEGIDTIEWSEHEMRDFLQQKINQQRLTSTIAELANRTSIKIFRENLETTEVTRTPAVVYRYLGFGGRMFAAPFVDPQIEWIKDWNSKDARIP